MAINPRIQARITQNAYKKRRELIRAANVGYLRGVKTAAKAAAGLFQSTDASTIEKAIYKKLKLVR